jgi:nicotinate-nucleotide adenylyltransferase
VKTSAAHWVRPPGPVAPGLRIGLLGGSFNPAHEGHLYVSEIALKRLGLDYVWWLVSPQNPLKSTAGMAALPERVRRARIVARHPRIVVTDIERGLGTRYSFDTLRALKRRFPQVEFTWLMGSDNLASFRRWHRWADLAALLPIAVIQRPGTVLAVLQARPIRRFGRLQIIDGKRNAQSATVIRARTEAFVGAVPPW